MLLKVEQICQNERIEVGRLGENDANSISFDFAAWVEKYGDGNITMLFQRPTEALIYPIALSVNGTVATWTVSETDTAISGKAHATLIYTVDEVIKKSAEFFCMVEKVLSANGQPPEPYEDYLAQIVAAGAAAEEAAGIAEGYAGSAEGYAADAKDYADAAKDSKDDAAGSAAGAYQSATDAEAAKDAILNMTATAEGLPAGSTPTVTKTEIGGIFNLAFGIPAGEKGAQGDPGTPGATGAPGQDGAPGHRGSIWFSGSGPSPDLPEVPQDGDLYLCNGDDIDFQRGAVYVYANGTWNFETNITGARGEGIPSGGTDGQILRRDTSAADGSVWQNVDNSPTANSTNLVESGGVASALAGKTGIDLGITGARVGNIAKVAAVDGNGAPTSWGSVSDYDDLQLIRETVLTAEANTVNILKATDGYSLKRARVIVIVPAVASPASRIFFVRSDGGFRYFWRATSTFAMDGTTLPIVDVTVFDKYTQTLAAIIPYNSGLNERGRSQGVTTFTNAQMQYQSQYGQRTSDGTPVSDEPPITNLQVGFTTGTHNFPIGTMVRLWGVRA